MTPLLPHIISSPAFSYSACQLHNNRLYINFYLDNASKKKMVWIVDEPSYCYIRRSISYAHFDSLHILLNLLDSNIWDLNPYLRGSGKKKQQNKTKQTKTYLNGQTLKWIHIFMSLIQSWKETVIPKL